VYEIQPEGNYREEATRQPTGRNIPHLTRPLEAHAEELGVEPAALEERLRDIRARLLVARQTRHAPARDDKVLTDWNGLAIWALAYAADVLEDAGERYAQAAQEQRSSSGNACATPTAGCCTATATARRASPPT
jgi:uncharacterized protein YyaL (SSP411 family)